MELEDGESFVLMPRRDRLRMRKGRDGEKVQEGSARGYMIRTLLERLQQEL